MEATAGAQVRGVSIKHDGEACRILRVLMLLRFCVSEYEDEDGPKHWSDLRYEHVMKLRQAALDTARQMWADYFLVRHLKCSPISDFTTCCHGDMGDT